MHVIYTKCTRLPVNNLEPTLSDQNIRTQKGKSEKKSINSKWKQIKKIAYNNKTSILQGQLLPSFCCSEVIFFLS